MPNTKSAEKRVRSSERKRLRNRAVKTRLKGLQKQFQASLEAGKKDDATASFPKVCSALDKAVKSGVIPRRTANRHKSRLATRLNQAR
jgi:small subunit ribosomal protein S20